MSGTCLGEGSITDVHTGSRQHFGRLSLDGKASIHRSSIGDGAAGGFALEAHSSATLSTKVETARVRNAKTDCRESRSFEG
jgi:hypothetical protein